MLKIQFLAWGRTQKVAGLMIMHSVVFPLVVILLFFLIKTKRNYNKNKLNDYYFLLDINHIDVKGNEIKIQLPTS